MSFTRGSFGFSIIYKLVKYKGSESGVRCVGFRV